MNDAELLRYSRQIMVPGLDIDGQARLLASRVLIVGLGGLGSPAALYLAAAGVGHLVLADFDRVEITNLQRQILHGSADVGRLKTESATDRLHALNPDTTITRLDTPMDAEQLSEWTAKVDLVVDGSDNFATRFAVNAACVAARRPLVSGAVIGMDGQLAVFRPDADGPCYRCVYADTGEEAQSCSETGVLGPLPGVIGSLQAVEVIKVLTGLGTPLNGRLLIMDALGQNWRRLDLRRDPDCPVCGQGG
ncbi:molybdopterin biosynthesis protein MoeB [Spiribacter salinus M19-40]|uniref:Molybdopterin-synthase adenylyltransferase n=1 Tax=Spiribacter salinus M19-40 TaxID=1260251 RepID=R4V6F9_9GAMM|nr:molybdopterin-synthase adenylyltransferase MoeB [Spiribacter salinus]AGM41514.1 molybdopterin biosynthesis protein MoeB [Spiribacter salinus M19-40]MBY5269104.1 molybdopterin-synthase adenylyltransferase MoeB [Spiribacter salinus]